MKRDGIACCHRPWLRRFWAKVILALRFAPRETDVGEPRSSSRPERPAFVEAALVRQESFLPAGQEHDVEFETLGACAASSG